MTTDSITSQEAAGLHRAGIEPASTTAAKPTGSPTGFRRRCERRRSAGYTLIEVALALVIIALLVGGILKGWQLVQASRVRTLIETSSAIQSAYFAFHDRFGRVPGDWNRVAAGAAIGVPLNGGGNDSGRLDTTPGDPWTESNAFWEHLAGAGFIHGEYRGTPAEPTVDNERTPLNVFNRPIIIGRTADFEGATVVRRHVIIGRGAPVGMLRELDNKLDDGKPGRGRVRATVDDAAVTVFGGANLWGGSDAACVDAVPDWNVNAESDDCNALLLF